MRILWLFSVLFLYCLRPSNKINHHYKKKGLHFVFLLIVLYLHIAVFSLYISFLELLVVKGNMKAVQLLTLLFYIQIRQDI